MKKLIVFIFLLFFSSESSAQIVRGTQFVFGTAALNSSRRVLTGAGSPESVITAPIGAVYLRTNGGSVTTAYLKESGTGNTGWIAVASTSGTLAQFAATTSAQLTGIISDETGSGALVFGTSPTFTTSVLLPSTNTYTGNGILTRNTADGSDSGYIVVTGGGADSGDGTRGALMSISGNEEVGRFGAGFLQFRLGNVTGSKLQFRNGANDITMLEFLGSTGDATFGGDLILPGLQTGAAGDTDACLDATTNELTDANASTCIVSSLRFKDVIAPLNTGLAEVLQFNPFSYSLKNDPLKVPQIGLSAEEMNEIEPRLVFYEKEGPDKGKPRGIMYEQSIALLVKAIQDLNAKVEALEQSRLRKLLPW